MTDDERRAREERAQVAFDRLQDSLADEPSAVIGGDRPPSALHGVVTLVVVCALINAVWLIPYLVLR